MVECSSNIQKNVIMLGQCDHGKCVRKDTQIKLFNGKNIPVQNIKKGDLLMGIDSKPREVLSTTQGYGEMFEVKQTSYGNTYYVNKEHILTLKVTGTQQFIYDQIRDRYIVQWITKQGLKRKMFQQSSKGETYKEQALEYLDTINKDNIGYKIGNIIDIPVKDFIKLNKGNQSYFKGFATGVEYEQQEISFCPYFLGLWLGDGTKSAPQVTNIDQPIIDFLYQWADQHNLKVTDKKPHFNLVQKPEDKTGNILTNELKKYKVWNNKHIPDQYKYNTRQIRLKVLAGLIDSDGYQYNNCYEIAQKNKTLAFDIVELCKSLGFRTTYNVCQKQCVNNGVWGEYVRIYISGEGLEEIPVLLERKKAHKRLSSKNALVSGIEITSIGDDQYFGFELSGDGRFLLEDFTVTHNSTLTGQLMVLTEQIDKRELQKLKDDAQKNNMETWWLSYLTDIDDKERQRGKTVETGFVNIIKDQYQVTIFDAPGHQVYSQNVINPMFCADIGVLLVSMSQKEYDAGLQQEHQYQGSTIQHLKMLRSRGISKIIVVMNKMDLIKWDQSIYQVRIQNIKALINNMFNFYLSTNKINIDQFVQFLPISAYLGINIFCGNCLDKHTVQENNELKQNKCKKYKELEWYNGNCLFKNIINTEIQQLENVPLIANIVDIQQDNKVAEFQLKIQQGSINVSQQLYLWPHIQTNTNASLTVSQMTLLNKQEINHAKAPQVIVVKLSHNGKLIELGQTMQYGMVDNVNNIGVNTKQKHILNIQQGNILTSPDLQIPCSKTLKIQLNLFTLSQQFFITQGKTLIAHMNGGLFECYIKKFNCLIVDNKQTTTIPKILRQKQKAIVTIEFNTHVAFQKFQDNIPMGSIMFRDGLNTIGCGHILQYIPIN